MLPLMNLLLLILIVEIWILAKLINNTLLLLGEDGLEKIIGFLIDIRNAVVKVKPGDVPQP
jgi:hypothetical protein